MLVIEPSFEILCMHIDPSLIEVAGRTCYKSTSKIGCSLPEDSEERIRCQRMVGDNVPFCSALCRHHTSYLFVKRLISRKHFSVLEHSLLTVRFITSRGITHEIVRHRLASFSQESTRYVNYEKKGMVCIRPSHRSKELLGEWQGPLSRDMAVFKSTNVADFAWLSAVIASENYYLDLLRYGERPEQARGVLPNDLKAEIVVSANAREWRHIFSLRTAKDAHPDMQQLMNPLLDHLRVTSASVLFDDI